MEVKPLIQRAADCLMKSKYAIALTGAGMSTESGIPDFRGPDGVWTKHPEAEKVAYETYFTFLRDPKEYWEIRLSQPYVLEGIEKAQPNAGHFALAQMEKLGILKSVVTQNIDGLHEKAGSGHVFEYHGSVHKLRCSVCDKRYRKEEFDLEGLRKTGELPPLCTYCKSAVKEDIVHFNEPIPRDVADNSYEEASKCDLMLICGTSAVVYPFASLPQVARASMRTGSEYGNKEGVTIIEVNAEPTQLTRTGVSDFLIQGRTAKILPEIIDLINKESNYNSSGH
jgi:NAD-dependent deacetylase